MLCTYNIFSLSVYQNLDGNFDETRSDNLSLMPPNKNERSFFYGLYKNPLNYACCVLHGSTKHARVTTLIIQ